MTALDVWYSSIDAEEVLSMLHDALTRKRAEKRLKKARHTTVAGHDFPELVDTSGATPVIKDSPPLIFHPPDRDREEFVLTIHRVLSTYRETLPEYRRVLLDRFQFVDIAVKVVGVGSVGTTCAIVLLMDAAGEPLFLQAKEACPSVLERYAGKSVYENHGQRVVVGYHLMQSASDIFLGWTEGGTGRHFYLRQLRDMKVKPLVESATPSVMTDYAELCGCTLARAHARSGEPAELTGYMGKSDVFDQAIADFSVAYADQSERDHEVFEKAVREGKLEVIVEEP